MNDKFLSAPIGPNRFLLPIRFLPAFSLAASLALKALSKLKEKKDLAATE